MFRKSLILATLATIALTGAAEARDQIRIVGSSTVFPFSTAVAEQFGKTSSFKTPIVESTGSGGGLKLFCAGVGDGRPDIANASRRIKKSEVERCASNGVTDIVEVKIGYDGIVMANSNKAKPFKLSLRDVFLGLAKDIPAEDGKTKPNPYKTWKQVNKNLPNIAIHVLGPPPTSGTRDAFAELAMEGGCKTFPWVKALKKRDKKAYKALCHAIREDGAFIEAGENDNLIVQKLVADKDALGIFGYSFLDQNSDKVQGSVINGHAPTFGNIADGKYPLSRPLFFYVKKAHMDKVAGIREFINEFTSDKTWGDEGYLADKGLIPMPKEERDDWKQKVGSLANFIM
ncbi:MAG TPA: PstS family phosphate ABC transporter substrate-binding protein [Rhodospirillales bacterium]|nr:PstS family phosphate ABC transporter substrate-binding protein [Rhodospirillales bacterium]